MTLHGLDDLARLILHELQRDARAVSSRDIAERVDASSDTVRKRIARLEETGVVTGYQAVVDEVLVRSDRSRPYAGFDVDGTDGTDDG